jgi:hypothetical protein
LCHDSRARIWFKESLVVPTFGFNMDGYIFEQELDDIRRAYEATIAALEKQHSDLEGNSLEFQRALAAGETEAAEYDEHGEKLYDYEDLHEMRIKAAVATIIIARQAYVVILHHYWEKCCNAWMQTGEDYKWEKACDCLDSHGLLVDRDGLEKLRKACNTIKHNNPLQLRPCDVDRMFEAVKTSGIRSDSDVAPPL